jgi:hypothetical protein
MNQSSDFENIDFKNSKNRIISMNGYGFIIDDLFNPNRQNCC